MSLVCTVSLLVISQCAPPTASTVGGCRRERLWRTFWLAEDETLLVRLKVLATPESTEVSTSTSRNTTFTSSLFVSTAMATRLSAQFGIAKAELRRVIVVEH